VRSRRSVSGRGMERADVIRGKRRGKDMLVYLVEYNALGFDVDLSVYWKSVLVLQFYITFVVSSIFLRRIAKNKFLTLVEPPDFIQ
jgi:hypothetical protein